MIYPIGTPITATGGVVGLKGNLAPEGAIVKVAGMSEADRQETAETLAFHAMAIAARHHDLQAAGAGPAVMSFRTEVAESVSQQQGIDLRRFALTPAGFEAR